MGIPGPDMYRDFPTEMVADTSMPDRTPAYVAGLRDALEKRPHRPLMMDHHLYTIGYREGQRVMGVPIEEAVPLDPAIPDPGDWPDKTKAWQDGWADSFRGGKTFESDRHLGQYEAGYKAGVEHQLLNNWITVNRARELMGIKDEFVQGMEPEFLTETVSVTRFDPPILFDPVKVPQHYNTGKIEVANFIADQGLDYVRGNVIKYVSRAGKKNPEKELEDLEKAAAYLQMAYNVAQGKPAVVRDPETKEVVWSLFNNEPPKKTVAEAIADGTFMSDK